MSCSSHCLSTGPTTSCSCRARDEAPNPFGSSYLDYLDLAKRQQTLSSLATTIYWTFTITGTPVPQRVVGHRVTGTHPIAAYRATSVSSFETMGLRVREGRGLTEDDRRGAPLVVVINRAMAATFWPGEHAIGKRFEFADGRNAGPLTVVGVADDVATDGLERNEAPAMYAPYVQRTLPFLRWMTLVARTEGDVNQHLATIRARLQALDPNQPLFGVSSMDTRIGASLAERRFSFALMSIFAGLTLVLAAMGLYGTLAQRVAERRRETGVRLALGAAPSEVFRLVMREGAWMVVFGVVIGAIAVWLSLPLVRESLFGVTPTDSWTYAALLLLLAVVTVLASWVPARAAARTDPVQTLRAD